MSDVWKRGNPLARGWTRDRSGFSPPLSVWFREESRPYVEDTLSARALARSGVFDPSALRAILDDHFALRANYDNQIWALLVFVTWQRQYLESSAGCSARSWG